MELKNHDELAPFSKRKFLTDCIRFFYVASECRNKISITSTSGGDKNIYKIAPKESVDIRREATHEVDYDRIKERHHHKKW